MRIMEIVSGTAVNGAVVTCLGTARALRARGHEVTVVCRPQAWIAEQLRNDDIPVIYSDLKRSPTQLRHIARVAREQAVDVVHTHMSSANFFGVLLRYMARIPCVATAHNRYLQLHWMFNDYVIACSEATRKFHHRVNLVRKSRIEVVHNFVDDRRFAGLTRDDGNPVRQEFGIADDRMLMGIIGDVIPRKGMLHLVRALPDIVRQIPQAHLLCVGHPKPDYAELVKAEADRLGVGRHITWAGSRSDIARVLSALDLYVLPSLEESLPLSILEAMAAGCPIVATAVGGIPESVEDGRNGFLVPPAQPIPLASAIVRVLSDESLRRRLSGASRQMVRERFSVDSHMTRLEQIFQRVAA